MKKRIFTTLLVLTMCLSMMPVTTWAGTCQSDENHSNPYIADGEGYRCGTCHKLLYAEVWEKSEDGQNAEPYYLDEDDYLDISSMLDVLASPNTEKIKLLANWESDDDYTTYKFKPSGLIFDLNGFTFDVPSIYLTEDLSLAEGSDITEYYSASVTVTDSSEEKSGRLMTGGFVGPGSSFTISGGTVETQIVIVRDNGKLNITGGELKTNEVMIQDSGMLDISGGKLNVQTDDGKGGKKGGNVNVYGVVTLSEGGEISCGTIKAQAANYHLKASITVNGGKINVSDADTAGINIGSGCTLNVSGGSLKQLASGSVCVNVCGGDANISGGNIDTLQVDSGSAKLSGGVFGKISVYEPNIKQVINILEDGYAYYTKDSESGTDHNKLTAETVKSGDYICVGSDYGIAVKTHKCSFVQQTGGRYICACGRSSNNVPVEYIDANGDSKYCLRYTELESSDGDIWWGSESDMGENDGNAWIVVKGNVTVNGKAKIGTYANAHIILTDGSSLTVNEGISGADSNSMSIYAQSNGVNRGKLTVNGNGVNMSKDLTVNGGNITVNSVYIVDYNFSSRNIHVDGAMTVNNGKLTVTIPNYTDGSSCGIYIKKDMTVNGGEVIVKAPEKANSIKDKSVDAYGISCAGKMTVTDGKVYAAGAGINASDSQSPGGKIVVAGYSCGIIADGMEITGGSVTAEGNDVTVNSRYIENGGTSYGLYIYEGEFKCSGGKFTAVGGDVSITGESPDEEHEGIYYSISGESMGIAAYRDTEVIISGGEVNAESGNLSITGRRDAYNMGSSNGIYIDKSMTVSGGKVNVAHGKTTGKYLEGNDEFYLEKYDIHGTNVIVSGGQMKLKETAIINLKVDNNVKLADLSASGYAYYKDGRFLKMSELDEINEFEYIYIRACKHDYTDGKCDYCGEAKPGSGSSSGGSSGSSSTVVKNPDGSTTTTVTDNKTGSVTETTKHTDGSITSVETKKDGTVTETGKTANGTTSNVVKDKDGNITEGKISISDKDAQNGGNVILPGKDVKPADSENAPEIDIELPGNSSVTIVIPVEKPTPGTVAVIVNKDGTETVIPGTKITEDGVQITITENCTIKIVENSKDFDDVKESDYFSDAVDWAFARGITGGVSERSFAPNENCARVQLVTFLWRAAGKPVVNFQMNFKDVDENAYYAEAVRWASSVGIINGYGNGIFGSNDPVTREQMAVILYRFAQNEGIDTSQGGMAVREFADYGSISDYASDAVQWAVNAGIMNGYDGKLMPKQPCSRAQIVTMLYRLMA